MLSALTDMSKAGEATFVRTATANLNEKSIGDICVVDDRARIARHNKGATGIVLILMLLAALYLCPALGTAQPALGTYQRPFAASSPWNTPITPGATYASAGFVPGTLQAYRASREVVKQFSGQDPLVPLYSKTWSQGDPSRLCQSRYHTTTLRGKLRLPAGFLVNCATCPKEQDGGRIAIVIAPGSTGEQWFDTRTRQLVDLKPGDVVEMFDFERCGNGQAAYSSLFASLETYGGGRHTLTGSGVTSRGAAGGSNMSILGGLVRAGEIYAGVPIPHALKLMLPRTPVNLRYCNSADPVTSGSGPGWRFPASKSDADCPNLSVNSHRQMGALYALLPTYNCAALRTTLGRQLCGALRTYGAYDADSQGAGMWAWQSESADASVANWTVFQEVLEREAIKIDYHSTSPTSNCFSAAHCNYIRDLNDMLPALQVVTNTSPDAPKGPLSMPPLAPGNLRFLQVTLP